MSDVAKASYAAVVDGTDPAEYQAQQQVIIDGEASTKVQAFLRDRWVRIQHVKRQEAAVIIQAMCKPYAASLVLNKVHRDVAVRVIQTAFRIGIARNMIASINEAAGIITHFWKQALPPMKKKHVEHRIYYSPETNRAAYIAALGKMRAGTLNKRQGAVLTTMYRAGLPFHPTVYDANVWQKNYDLMAALKNAKPGEPTDVMRFVTMDISSSADHNIDAEENRGLSRFVKLMVINPRVVDVDATAEYRDFLQGVPRRLAPFIKECGDSTIFQMVFASIEAKYDRSDAKTNGFLNYLQRVCIKAFQGIITLGKELEASTTAINSHDIDRLANAGVEFYGTTDRKKEWVYSAKLPACFLEMVVVCPAHIQGDLRMAGTQIEQAMHYKNVLSTTMELCRTITAELVTGE